MAKQTQNHKKPKRDLRHTVTAILALVLAALMLLPMLSMIIPNAGAVTQADIDALKEQQSAVKARQQQLKDQLAALKDDQATAQKKADLLGQQLNAIVEELRYIQSQIDAYTQQIDQKEVERQEAVLREEEQYERFCKRVRAMEEDGTVSHWSLIFQAKDFGELLDLITIANAVVDYDNKVMDDLRAAREEIERIKSELEAAKAEQEAKKAEQEERRAEQAELVKEANAALAEVKANAAAMQELLDAADAELAKVNKDIIAKQKQMEEERRQQGITIDTETNYMWPLPPDKLTLTSAFGPRTHPVTHEYSNHLGTDISAPNGTPIYAAKSGQVITSKKGSGSDWSYGEYVVIDHGNGNSTLYAHMSRRNVSSGQMVKQGDIIGYVGSTGRSTGNHLHYEVRINYQRVDAEKQYPSLYNSFYRKYNE